MDYLSLLSITYWISNIKCCHWKWTSAFKGRKMQLLCLCMLWKIRSEVLFTERWAFQRNSGGHALYIYQAVFTFSKSILNMIYKTGCEREMFWIRLSVLKWKTSHCHIARRSLILIGQSQTTGASPLPLVAKHVVQDLIQVLTISKCLPNWITHCILVTDVSLRWHPMTNGLRFSKNWRRYFLHLLSATLKPLHLQLRGLELVC